MENLCHVFACCCSFQATRFQLRTGAAFVVVMALQFPLNLRNIRKESFFPSRTGTKCPHHTSCCKKRSRCHNGIFFDEKTKLHPNCTCTCICIIQSIIHTCTYTSYIISNQKKRGNFVSLQFPQCIIIYYPYCC